MFASTFKTTCVQSVHLVELHGSLADFCLESSADLQMKLESNVFVL